MDYENYEGRMACYETAEGSVACFIPKCPICAKFVKAGTVLMNINGVADLEKPNAVCKTHGEVTMPFDGYWNKEDLE